MNNSVKMYCNGNNEVLKSCIDERCSHPSLMCGLPRCKCSESHKLCKGTNEYQPIINQLAQKTNNAKRPYENLAFWYNNLAKQVNMEKEELLKKMDALVGKILDPNEVIVLEAINEGKSWKITGQIMSKLLSILKKPSLSNNAVQEQIKSDISKANKDIQDYLVKMRKIWDFEKDEKICLEKIKKCGIRWTWLNGKWIKPVPDEFHLSELTGLGLDFLDSTVTKILSSSCPKLQGLQIGYWVTNSNLDDGCAEVVSEHLPHLKRLWIYNSPLNDKGSIAISNSLKALQYLIINNCRLSAVGKSQVRRLLPDCKKIQLL